MDLDRIGKYRVVAKIGQGAMGEVYKAHDPLLNRFVALKTISPALAADPEFRQRFRREAQSAAQLNHPNIITIFDFGEEDGLTYMAMELLDGSDLRAALRARSLGHVGRRLEVMRQICDGLAFAHERGVVHRDLKPGNIHLQLNGHVKILDFGLARLAASDMTRSGTVMGTPHYMSPEQVQGQKADARSDVFSLGAVFYEVLTQHRAFDADSVHGVLQQIVEKEPEPLRRWAPDTPPGIASVVDRALAKEPARRFADAGEMGRALARQRDALAGETLGASTAPEDEAERTRLTAGDRTITHPLPASDPRHAVTGATALDLGRTATGRRSELPGTVRPDPTVAEAETHLMPAEPSGPSRGLVLGAVVTVALVAAVGALFLRSRTTVSPLPPTGEAEDQVGILTEAWVTSQVELARADLDNRDYAAAIAGAQKALELDSTSAEAREVLEQAQRAQQELESAVAEARGAAARGETARATEALGRALALDPRHPVAAELSQGLNRHFRAQAEAARRTAASARADAEGVRATSAAAFATGRRVSTQAETLFRDREFALAAQKFLEAQSAFEAARREAELARLAAASPPPSRQVAAPAGTMPTARVLSPPAGAIGLPAATVAPPPAPTMPPTAAPAPQPTAPSPTALARTPVATAPAPSVPSLDSQEAAVRRIIADYGRAIATRDVELYRSLKPDLSSDEEKRLRDAFKSVTSHQVGIQVELVEFAGNGNEATVRVARQDTVNGRPQARRRQLFRLARSGGAWRLVSMAPLKD